MAYNRFAAVDEAFKFPPEVRAALATDAVLRNVVVPMTQTQRNNLTGADLWDGRTIVNTTTDRVNRYDAGTDAWYPIADFADIAANAADPDHTHADPDMDVAGDPVIQSDSTGWVLSDFGEGGSGDTYQMTTVRFGIVEVWGLGVLNTNGPAFAPDSIPAKQTFIQLPVAPTDLRTRHVIGEWLLTHDNDSSIAGGTLRYDPEHVGGQHWARLSASLNTSFQMALGYHMRYPLNMP